MAIDATSIVDIRSGFHVFGHSWGTIVATLYAAKQPTGFRKKIQRQRHSLDKIVAALYAAKQPTGLRKNTKTKKQFGHDRCRSLCSKTS